MKTAPILLSPPSISTQFSMLNYIHFPVEKIVCQKGKKPVTNTGELPALKHFYVYIFIIDSFIYILQYSLQSEHVSTSSEAPTAFG